MCVSFDIYMGLVESLVGHVGIYTCNETYGKCIYVGFVGDGIVRGRW